MLRAKETLKQIVDEQDVIYSPDLREKSWGEHEGMSYNEIKKFNKKCVLVVTHSGVIKSFIAGVRGISLEEAFSLSLPYGCVAIYDNKKEEIDIWA